MKKIDKDELKFNLSIDQVADLVNEMGGEVHMGNESFTARTICHCGQSHKLYYWENTHLFRCFTECSDIGAFDIYELTRKVKSREENKEWSLPHAISYVANYYGYSAIESDYEDEEHLQDWDILKNYDKLNSIEDKKIIELNVYDDKILKYLPRPKIEPWLAEGITQEVMNECGICYDPINQGIVIPHYDINNRLIGIRERTLIKEDEIYGKYRPAILCGVQYNHPLSFNLYNLNHSKNNIKDMGIAIIGEGEKFCLKYRSWFGDDNDLSVAVCGSNLISYQVKLLIQNGAKEIVIAFDKQWQQSGDDEFKRWVKKLTEIDKKYSPYVSVSFMFDKNGDLLGYKDSPVDKTKEIFLQLFESRIRL